MNIVDKRNVTKRIEFCHINKGDVFEYGGVVHMKIDPIEFRPGEVICNAIEVYGGRGKKFKIDDSVVPLNCNLVIEQ